MKRTAILILELKYNFSQIDFTFEKWKAEMHCV